MSDNISPVRKQITVDAPQERAFRVFTQNIGRWWPREYHIGGSDMQDAVIEPRADGRWYEVGVDGTQCDWGRVLVWEPPHRLVLTWQITARWAFDPTFATEVEVRFTAQGAARTLVELEHRHLERYGDAAAATRDTMDSGWPGIMQRYADVVHAPEA